MYTSNYNDNTLNNRSVVKAEVEEKLIYNSYQNGSY